MKPFEGNNNMMQMDVCVNRDFGMKGNQMSAASLWRAWLS